MINKIRKNSVKVISTYKMHQTPLSYFLAKVAMDDPKSPFLSCTYFHQDKLLKQNMDELMKQSLVLNMELEHIRLRAQDEIKSRDQQIAQLKTLLTTTIQQRDEAQHSLQNALLQKLLLQQKLQHNSTQQHSGTSSIEDEIPKVGIDSKNYGFSDCDESIVSSPLPQEDFPVVLNKPLPQKGKLLEAVIKAGPLLQTLLLAGPLPRWRHPPPSLNAYQIPPSPVVIPSTLHLNQDDGSIKINNFGKRVLPEWPNSANDFKYQRVVPQ